MALSSWLKNLARAPATPVALAVTPTGGSKRGGVKPPQRRQGPYSWSLQRIREVRDQQMRGCFDMPVRLAEAFRTDDALFTAYQARCATQSAIALSWNAAQTDGGAAVEERARRAIKVPQHVRQSILGTMANHGVAIGYVEQSTVDTADGPTVAFTLTEWPLEFVRYIIADGTLETRVKDGGLPVKITHGDGRWVMFAKFGVLPWTQDACLLPAALLWAAHAEGLADWAGASAAHGQPRVVGELPEGVPLGDGQGGLSPDASKFLDLITDLINGEAAAGIRPAGAKTDWIANQSSAWQVFTELINNREGAAAKIYLGTDAILGARGGAPGVDVAALFGIATTRIQGDLEALERGFWEGVILPWCALHGVESDDAPRLVYELPDVDKDKRSEQEGAAIERLADAIDAMKRAGLEVTQDVIDRLARVLGVSVPCEAAAAETKVVPLQLAPTDVARVVTVNEARASQGLPALDDERGTMMISDLERQADAEAEALAGGVAPTGSPEAVPAEGEVAPAAEPEEPEEPEEPAGPTRKRVLPRSTLGPRLRVTAQTDLDGDGDGKLNEEDLEEVADAASEAIDGDGDGKVDEVKDEDPRITRSRKNLAKALDKYERKQIKLAEAQKEFDESLAEYRAFDAKREAADSRVEDADEALEAADGWVSEAKETHEAAEGELADFDALYGDFDPTGYETDEERDAAKSEWETERAEARKEHTNAVDAAAADLDAAKAQHAKAKDESKQASKDLKDLDKEEKAAERRHERAEAKHEKAFDAAGDDDLNEALIAHSDAHGVVVGEAEEELRAFEAEVFGDSDEAPMTPEQEAKHARLTERHARAVEKEQAVDRILGRPALKDDGTAEDPDPDAPKTAEDQARVILTGPNGGQYYINESGEKEYVK